MNTGLLAVVVVLFSFGIESLAQNSGTLKVVEDMTLKFDLMIWSTW